MSRLLFSLTDGVGGANASPTEAGSILSALNYWGGQGYETTLLFDSKGNVNFIIQ